MAISLKALSVLLCLLAAPTRLVAGGGTDAVDFAQQIAPLLEKHCLRCHGPETAKGGLRLDGARPMGRGGDSGPVVRAGHASDSELVRRVRSRDPDERMPQGGEPLNESEIALLERWIDSGAGWPQGLTLRDAAQRHWSFQPIRREPAPSATAISEANAANPIDAFILERLRQEQLEPSPPALRETLIRRVTLDLIGLPPTPDEVAAFVDDEHPAAYQRLIERLLASPHYGERWARPWLDLCHYADSDGYLTDQLRPVAWRYRQWLVEALNRNLSFDQFTIQQLAGDLLAGASEQQRIATGFLRQTLSNREGGADLEEFRVKQVIDRTQMVGTAWLGLTVGCARCHDHKYDPLTQREFFGLFACLNNADEVNFDAPLPAQRDAYRASRAEYERQRARRIGPLRDAIEQLQRRWESKLLHAFRHPGRDHTWDRQWELLGLIWGGGLGEGQLEGTEIVKLPWDQRTARQRADLLDYFLKRGSIVDPDRFTELKLGELSGALEELKNEFPGATRAPAMQAALTRRPTYLHQRGDFRLPGQQVQPGTPGCLPDWSPDEHLPRMALARWLVSPDNPLTARVAVNRMWQAFFGRGLVLTSEDFGTRGESPSHPRLLDWLAARFIDSGWDVKAMHRLIVSSATYRQSSVARRALARRDPDNVLLARQASLRLSAEAVRDAGLAASGLLCARVGGPSVKPPQPERVTMEAFGYNQWEPSLGADRYRRALYTVVLRASPFAQSVTFDAPNPNEICTRRVRSNTPLQALTLLNDPVFFEMAGALADRVLGAPLDSDRQRIEYAFRLCCTRSPEPDELERLQRFLDQQLSDQQQQQQPRQQQTQQQLGARFHDDVGPARSMAWTNLCSVLLNLHEFITRD